MFNLDLILSIVQSAIFARFIDIVNALIDVAIFGGTLP